MLLQRTVGPIKPSLGHFAQELCNERYCHSVLHICRKREGLLQDLLVDLVGIFGIFSKRYVACHELVQHDT